MVHAGSWVSSLLLALFLVVTYVGGKKMIKKEKQKAHVNSLFPKPEL